MPKNKELFGTTLAFITAFISGFAIFINKIFVVQLDPIVFTATRAIIIGAVFFVISLYTNKWKFKGFKKVPWKYLLAIGVIGGGLAFFLFFSGLKLTTSGKAAFLHKTLPLYVTILAFFFLKEKITKKQILALLVMFAGTLVLVSVDISPAELWMNPQFGDALVITATILWGVENVIARKALIKGETNFVVSFARMFFGAIFLFGIMLLTNKFSLLAEVTPTQWGNIMISTAILFGYVLSYYWAIKYINVSKAATILLISPVITLILGVAFLNEPAPPIQLLGSLIILVGAYLISGVKSEFSRI